MVDEARLYELIGDRIRKIREMQTPRMSQEELAKILQLNRTSVTNIEKGKQKVTLDTLYRLCTRFGLEMHDVLPSLADLKRSKHRSVVVGGHAHRLDEQTASAVARARLKTVSAP